MSGREQLKTELESIPKVLDPKSEKALIERRDTLYGEYLQLVITTSKLLEEIALTYPSDAPEYKSNFGKPSPNMIPLLLAFGEKVLVLSLWFLRAVVIWPSTIPNRH